MLRIQQTLDQGMMLMQSQWSKELNPVLANPIWQGSLVPRILLINGTTTFDHFLGRQMQGWFLVDQNAAAAIFRPAAFPLNNTTLTLTSNAVVTVNLWVF